MVVKAKGVVLEVTVEPTLKCFHGWGLYYVGGYFVQNEFQADESDEENQSKEDQSDESSVKGGSHESHDTSDSEEEVESRNDKGAARFQWTEKLTLIIKNAFSSCINAPTGSRLPSKMEVLGFMNKHQLIQRSAQKIMNLQQLKKKKWMF
ncbi:hypothetical protein CAPTEDRAFT_228064 [Capitella teleta]|uniref:Uncharacterized protein n=1 Tax=Capitella teleta TaxID=283909 RepID=R7TMA2_CAPTE|nr:hypothetical protein CAPTEDRAFT_228064 [Capitella teleta]|eukprot:ELT94764.1 hypothetical protein CAPTEDRAFT_228064 [Capitella teleta]